MPHYRMNYIVFDLGSRKVTYETSDKDNALEYIDNHQEKALYLITLTIDRQYPCLWKLEGCAY